MRAAIEGNADHAGARRARARGADGRQAHEPGDGMKTDFGWLLHNSAPG
jgi:hypothetical protein